MMLHTHHLNAYVHAHQQDLMTEAEQWRTAQQHKIMQSNHLPPYAALLAQTGKFLTRAGDYLQTRYSQAISPIPDTGETPCVTC